MLFSEYENRKNEANGSQPSKLSVTHCTQYLIEAAKHTSYALVIDGMDECDQNLRYQLFDSLNQIVSTSEMAVKVFISSRDDRDIKEWLENWPHVYILASENRNDIDEFIETEVTQSIRERRLLHGKISQAMKEQIVSTLSQGAGGMSVFTINIILCLSSAAGFAGQACSSNSCAIQRKSLWRAMSRMSCSIFLSGSQLTTNSVPNGARSTRIGVRGQAPCYAAATARADHVLTRSLVSSGDADAIVDRRSRAFIGRSPVVHNARPMRSIKRG